MDEPNPRFSTIAYRSLEEITVGDIVLFAIPRLDPPDQPLAPAIYRAIANGTAITTPPIIDRPEQAGYHSSAVEQQCAATVTGIHTENDVLYLCIGPDPDDTTRALSIAMHRYPDLRVFIPAPEHTA